MGVVLHNEEYVGGIDKVLAAKIGTSALHTTSTNLSDAVNEIVDGQGTASAKDFTTSVTSGSADLVTSGAVSTAINNLPKPMVYAGTLGTGGTISTLPAASIDNKGLTYKVITAGTYASQEANVGDVFTSNGSEWVRFPAGDPDTDTWRPIKVNGTEVAGSGISTGYLNFINGTNTTVTFNSTNKTIKVDATGGTDVNVTQTATTDDDNYEVLLSGSADNTTRTEGAKKNDGLLFNPYLSALTVGGRAGSTQGEGSIATNYSEASGQYAIALGYTLDVSGSCSVAEGELVTVSGDCSHGEGNQVTVSGDYSHGEGYGVSVTSDYSHGEGYETAVAALYAHAEGYQSQVEGNYSHAEGSNTFVDGESAHAEGGGTTATGYFSHAEGVNTVVTGWAAHAEGGSTNVDGSYAHVEGYFTTATHKAQHVVGEYNEADPSVQYGSERGNYVEIVGNGTGSNSRSNARTLDWDGNEVLAGKLTVGTAPTANMDVATKQYVDNAISALPEPMIYQGTVGTGGTIADLPAASAANKGYTYKVITAGTYASQAAKVGDVFTSNATEWVLFPSGDSDTDTWRNIQVNGTEVLGTGLSSGPLKIADGNNTTAVYDTTTNTLSFDSAAMTILAYGKSTWADFLAAYNRNAVVYARASSNANPATGAQNRMAFMAYVNADPPTEVEFQYYRSVSSHSATQQGDQVFIYKLNKNTGWSVTTREAMSKIAAGTNMTSSYSNGVLTLNADTQTPSAADVSVDPTGMSVITDTDAQGAFSELDTEVSTINASLTQYIKFKSFDIKCDDLTNGMYLTTYLANNLDSGYKLLAFIPSQTVGWIANFPIYVNDTVRVWWNGTLATGASNYVRFMFFEILELS